MIISSYIDDWTLTVLSSNYRYRYFNVSPHIYNRVNQLVGKKLYGKAWQILKKFQFEKQEITKCLFQKKH